MNDPVETLEALGYTPHLFRPPGGSYDEAVVEAAAQAGMRTIMWSIGTGDFVDDVPPHHILHAVLVRLRPGGIILLHDADGSSTWDHTATVKVLPNLIEEIRQRGYEFMPLEPYLSPERID